MESTFSPKQIAVALRVSESSIKRWCDQGAIVSTKTHGGHRRIPLDGLIAFLNVSKRRLVQPAAIGMENHLRPTNGVELAVSSNVRDEAENGSMQIELESALIRGDESQCRRILSHSYLQRPSFAWMADELIAPVFHKIGERWHASSIDVFHERRSCEICMRLIHEFRRSMAQPLLSSPLAIGCTTTGDYYSIPGQLIEIILRDIGWRATNLGMNLPLSSLAAAVRAEKPKLVWLSVSHSDDRERLMRELQYFWESIPHDITLVVGGRGLTDELRPRLRYTAHCDTLQQLAMLAKSLHSSVSK